MENIPKSKNLLKSFVKEIPSNSGVYEFISSKKNTIYVGKAKNIRKRIFSYFRESVDKTEKLKNLLRESTFLKFTITNNELEALLLEQHLIKEIKPKFNVQFKDDKGYPWIRVQTSKEFPSAGSFLGKKEGQDSFFGPYPNSYAVKDSLNLLQKTFKIRNCSDSFFSNRRRPCIQYEIGRCSAPCVGLIDKNDYLKDVQSTLKLFEGKSEELISDFYNLMDRHSKAKSFEKAALYRDKISSLREIQRNQSIAGYSKSRDAIASKTVNGITKVGVTHVKGGWVTGHENFVQQNISIDLSVIESFLLMHYLSQNFCPSTLVLGERIRDKLVIEDALSQYHKKKVQIITKLGAKDKGLYQICKSNTDLAFRRNQKKGYAKEAFLSLKKELSLRNEIEIIESYDVSHHSGSKAVAGCVVYDQNGKDTSQYRLFNIHKKNSGKDIPSMLEVLERRFNNRNLKLKDPSLIIIDGGKVHLSNVLKKLEELKIKGIEVIAISKGARRKPQMDSIHTRKGSLNISQGSLVHLFIQEIRDETHRFSISNQKKKLNKSLLYSSLDTIEGVGAKRKRLLLRYFGSVEQINRASLQDLLNVPSLGSKTANSIYNQLH